MSLGGDSTLHDFMSTPADREDVRAGAPARRSSGDFRRREAADARLVRIADSAFAEARRRAGAFLVCYPGCGKCCVGAIPINVLDARRLERGMRRLLKTDPGKAGRILKRAREAVAHFGPALPGDPETGIFADDEEAQTEFYRRFTSTPCPALGPESGRCEVYEFRPVACRIAGPPMRLGDEKLPHCDLCFQGATRHQIEAARVDADSENYELSLLAEEGLEQTLIGYALMRALNGQGNGPRRKR